MSPVIEKPAGLNVVAPNCRHRFTLSMSMRLGTRSSRHGFSRSWNIEESNTRSSKASANICGSGPHGLVAPSCLAKRILSKRRSSRRRRLLIGPSPLKRSDLSRPSHRIEKAIRRLVELGLRRRNRWIKDRQGMAATAALAHDSRHITGDCRPNRTCDEPQEAAEGSARPAHRAKPRAASPTATAAGSARLPATKESALTLIELKAKG